MWNCTAVAVGIELSHREIVLAACTWLENHAAFHTPGVRAHKLPGTLLLIPVQVARSVPISGVSSVRITKEHTSLTDEHGDECDASSREATQSILMVPVIF